ncbi:hypothetical protein [Maribacter ulvicola]|uniref:Protein required for attachment to host cells n=1 Tax=Maribacter ulvicola TaxID=228959 RepID=A0A1N6Z3T9_9FLAO|nr:hypothetical protein [Maribacter ulvicola]SIR21466.1 hypothetical protein SAMN05421797_10817 [Maribacter ulvicola]
MNKIGIWMDSKQAFIVRLTKDTETVETIHSNIEFYNKTGTGGSRVKSGATQDVIHDRKYLEKEKYQFKHYFNSIVEAVTNSHELMIFGPADINEKFKKELEKYHKSTFDKLKAVEKTDSMTINQKKAYVRDFFKKQ